MDRKDKSRRGSSRSAGAASMAALAAAATAGEGSSSGSADGALRPSGEEEDKKPAKVAAVGGASSSSPVPARRGAAVAAGRDGPRCQAERCNADLNDAGQYNRRHKVCQTHSKAPVVLVAGLRQRFCQQCSRFHELSEFDDIKRSCRQRLAGHNERRRKSSADAHGGGSIGSGGGDGCRHGDQDGRGHQGNPPPNHFQIR